MALSLMITARRAGHRRAGMAHPGEPTLHDPSSFNAEQLHMLRKDPQLVVVDVEPSEPVTIPTKKGDLQGWLDQAGVEFTAEDTVKHLTEKAEAYLHATSETPDASSAFTTTRGSE